MRLTMLLIKKKNYGHNFSIFVVNLAYIEIN